MIHPEGIWYHCRTQQDVDEIIARHFILQQPVQRLQLTYRPPEQNMDSSSTEH